LVRCAFQRGHDGAALAIAYQIWSGNIIAFFDSDSLVVGIGKSYVKWVAFSTLASALPSSSAQRFKEPARRGRPCFWTHW